MISARPLTWKQFGVQWLTACIFFKLFEIGFDGIALLVANAVKLDFFPPKVYPGGLIFFLIGFRLVSGALGGGAQWLVLRQWLPSSRIWVLATSLGSAMAFIILIFLSWATLVSAPAGVIGLFTPAISGLPNFVFDSLQGLMLGLAQWIVLRSKLPHSLGWAGVSCLGWMLSGFSISLLQRILGQIGLEVGSSSGNPLFWVIAAVGFLAYGVTTGLFWIRRLGRSG